jgi:uncharacterized Zn finger protein
MKNKLITQGFEYYWNGAVNQFSRTEAATYQARVTIEENHTVTLKVDAEGDVDWTKCKCSCSHSPYCKHIAAVYVAQQQQNNPIR